MKGYLDFESQSEGRGTSERRNSRIIISFTLCCRRSLFAADVSLEMEGEMVRAGKRAVTVEALEWPGTGVLAEVSCELV